MIVSEMTLEEFLSFNGVFYPSTEMLFEEYVRIVQNGFEISPAKYLGDGYTLHYMIDDRSNVVLCKDSNVVGVYIGEAVVIENHHRRKGLSVPLILLAAQHRSPPKCRKLTMAGEKALTCAWKVANCMAESPWWK